MTPPAPNDLARAVRRSARVALWAGLAGTLLGAYLLFHFARPLPVAGMARIEHEQNLWSGVDFADRPEVRLLQDLVRIDTSEPNPDEVAAADYLAAQLGAAGVRAHVEHFRDRRANLWAFVEGDDPKAVVLHGHLDVEPLLEDGPWRHPPLSAAIDGPWIYGRGMYDMKSLTAAQLLAVLDVARSGRRPKRSLLFLATSSEEAGSDLGTRWILAQHPELVARMGIVLDEGGVVEGVSPTDIKYWGIEFAQKHFARIYFCSSSKVDLEALRDLLVATGKGAPLPDVDPRVRAFLASYGPTRSLGLYRELLADPDRLTRESDRFERLSPFLQSLFRNEVVPFRLEEAEGGGWRLAVAVHLLPDSDLEPVLDRLLPAWKTWGMVSTPPLADRLRRLPDPGNDPARRRAGRARGPLLPALDRHRRALLPAARHSRLRTVAVRGHGQRDHRHRQAQRAHAAARLRARRGTLSPARPCSG
jgi:hypothetical protein